MQCFTGHWGTFCWTESKFHLCIHQLFPTVWTDLHLLPKISILTDCLDLLFTASLRLILIPCSGSHLHPTLFSSGSTVCSPFLWGHCIFTSSSFRPTVKVLHSSPSSIPSVGCGPISARSSRLISRESVARDDCGLWEYTLQRLLGILSVLLLERNWCFSF